MTGPARPAPPVRRTRTERICRALLVLYPPAVRARDGEELLQVVRDLEFDLRGGALARARLLVWVATDLIRGAIVERLVATSPKVRSCFAFVATATVLGAVGGWVDLRNREVQPAAACLLLFTALLSAVQPRRAWLAVLLVGAGVPVADLLARSLGWPIAWQNPSASAVDYFIPFLPALVGALLGVGTRWVIARRQPVTP